MVSALGLATLLLAAASAGPALADQPQSFVREQAIDMLEGALSPEQITTLQLTAYQVAIASSCEGFQLDPAKFEKVFGTLAPEDAAKMTDEQRAYFDKHLLVIYGVLVGGELAAMQDDISKGCAEAAATRSDPAMADELVWQ